MKPNIHPQYVEATVTCACGNSWTTRSTRPVLRTELCSNCHPYFSGEHRIVDTAGQVDRFLSRQDRRQQAQHRHVAEATPVAPRTGEPAQS